MPHFRNLWTEDNAAVHRCDDCGGCVMGLSGMMEHVCATGKEDAELLTEEMADARMRQIDGKS